MSRPIDFLHAFMGRQDRDCDVCGFPDRNWRHFNYDGKMILRNDTRQFCYFRYQFLDQCFEIITATGQVKVSIPLNRFLEVANWDGLGCFFPLTWSEGYFGPKGAYRL